MRIILLTILTVLLAFVCACGYRTSEKEYRTTEYAPRPQAEMNDGGTLEDFNRVGAGVNRTDAEMVAGAEAVGEACKVVVANADPTDSRDLGPGAQNEHLPPPTPKRARSAEKNPIEPGFSTDDASTFAVDVDSGSWNFARQALRNGRLPDADSIRVEEFINSFHYRYAAPRAGAPLGWDAAYVPCPWNAAHGLLRVAVQAREVEARARPATNLVLLIDTSGSMSSRERLPLLRTAFSRMIEQLDARDRVAIVTYAGSAGIALEPTAGSDHERIREALNVLSSGGGTHGSGGIRTAYDLARRSFVHGGQNRVMLATDGDFNMGVTDQDDLEKLIRKEAASGVLLTVLGVGDSASGDRRMEHLADCGDGVYAFLDNEKAANHALTEQLASNLVTVARNAKIQLFFNPATVAGWKLIGYTNRQLARRDFNDDRIDGGEVGAGHQVTALYEIIPNGDANPFIDADRADRGAGLCRLRLRWQPVAGGASQLLERDISTTREDTLDRESGWAAAMAMTGLKLHGELPQVSWSTVITLAKRCAETSERSEALEVLYQAARLSRD